MLAYWLHAEPGAPDLSKRIEEAQGKWGMRRGSALSMPSLQRLARFFEADAAANSDQVTPEVASAEAQLFARFYYHAVPFERRYLLSLFARCETSRGNAFLCSEERAKAERELGDLSVEVGAQPEAPSTDS